MAKTKELMYICTNNNNSIVESMFQRLNKIFSNEYVLNKLSTRKIANFARRKNINATFVFILLVMVIILDYLICLVTITKILMIVV